MSPRQEQHWKTRHDSLESFLRANDLWDRYEVWATDQRPSKLCLPGYDLERLEREIVDSMHLVQLERRRIEHLKPYRLAYNRIKDYLQHEVQPTIDSLKEMVSEL